MTDILRRSLAPLTPEAWNLVDDTVRQVLQSQLTARTLVDLEGPHGFSLGAVNLGQLHIADTLAPGEVCWGIRRSQPVIEIRVAATVAQLQLDNVFRGSKNPDFGDLEAAARKLAHFEETVLYRGLESASTLGIATAATQSTATLPPDPARYTQAVADGVKTLAECGIGGPYALVLNADIYFTLMQSKEGGYPPRRIIREFVEAGIHWSPALDGGVILSQRGGDYQLTLGQDISVGYASHDRDNVELYLTESFAFQVIEPAAAVALRAPKQLTP